MAVSRDSIQLETKYHIPTVSAGGINVVPFGLGPHPNYSTGMPLRFVGFPFPFTGRSREVYRSFIEGEDQVSGKPMMQAIVEGLTRPLSAAEKLAGPSPQAQPEPRYLKADTEENLQRLFKDKGWTDFNPIILPTEERVKAMLKGTSHKPDELVKTGAGTFGTGRPFSVEKVAIIAVMAGAKPEYLPVILALSNRVPYIDSTTSNASMVLINGPIREEIGMNSGIGALGPEGEANSIIGRSMNLIHFIIQGYQEGTHYQLVDNPRRIRGTRVEVMEFFSYGCPHCFELESYVAAWREKNRDRISFVRSPVIFNEGWRGIAQSYYASEALNVTDEIHLELFDEVQRKNNATMSIDHLAGIFASNGVSEEAFRREYASPGVRRQVDLAEQRQQRFKIPSVPAVVVNGKYLVVTSSNVGLSRMLDVVDHLIDQETTASQSQQSE